MSWRKTGRKSRAVWFHYSYKDWSRFIGHDTNEQVVPSILGEGQACGVVNIQLGDNVNGLTLFNLEDDQMLEAMDYGHVATGELSEQNIKGLSLNLI